MKHKALAYTFVVLVFAATISLLYYVEVKNKIPAYIEAPVHKKNNNPQIYINDKYNFEFEYPKEWGYKLINERSDGYYIDKVYDSRFSLTMLSKSYEGIKQYKNFTAKLSNNVQTKVAFYGLCHNLGCDSIDESKPRIMLVSLAHGELAEDLDLEFSFSRNDEDEAWKIFEQILSTFKFID